MKFGRNLELVGERVVELLRRLVEHVSRLIKVDDVLADADVSAVLDVVRDDGVVAAEVDQAVLQIKFELPLSVLHRSLRRPGLWVRIPRGVLFRKDIYELG